MSRPEEKPHQEARPRPKVFLKEIPHQLVFNILKRMPCLGLIRMRKTCKYMNQTVEENKEIFAKRVHVGIHLVLLLKAKYEHSSELFYFHKNDNPQLFTMDSPIEARFSGVSVKSLSVIRVDGDKEELIAAFLRRLNIRCDEMDCSIVGSIDYVVQLTDLVECRTTHLEDVYIRSHDNPISTLQSAHNKTTFVFDLKNPNYVLDQFEQLLNFQKVRCTISFTTEQIHSLFWIISQISDFGSLKEISIAFRKSNPFKDQNSILPPTKLLWEKEGIYKHPNEGVIPDYILKFGVAGEKCNLIIRPTELFFNPPRIRFLFNINQADVLKILTENLCIKEFESVHAKTYQVATEDQQSKMIRKFYVKKHAVRSSRRLRGIGV